MELKTPSFKNEGNIPTKHTCDGEDISPMVEIFDIPEKTKSLAFVIDDPDASTGTWDHWVVWNIDPRTHYILEDSAPMGAVEGKTGFSRRGFSGPCPPKGDKPHRYFFKAYALDDKLELSESAGKKELEHAMEGHILTQAELIGLYQRR